MNEKQQKELDAILRRVHVKHDVDPEHIVEYNNHPFVSQLRKRVWKELYTEKYWTLSEIAYAFGRDKSTVQRGIKSV
jgi:predicted transcriptional regulator